MQRNRYLKHFLLVFISAAVFTTSIAGTPTHKSSFINGVKEIFAFVKEFIKSPATVGAILPSSKWLAKEIVSSIPKDRKAGKRIILEIGPGTGIFTEKILKRMNPEDELHLVELDHSFSKQLAHRYKKLIAAGKVKIYNCSILDPNVSTRYDYIISGLPLNAFEREEVDQILEKFSSISKTGGKLSYFDYPIAKELACIFTGHENRQRLEHIQKAKDDFYRLHADHEENVYFNIPPARVLHHTMK